MNVYLSGVCKTISDLGYNAINSEDPSDIIVDVIEFGPRYFRDFFYFKI